MVEQTTAQAGTGGTAAATDTGAAVDTTTTAAATTAAATETKPAGEAATLIGKGGEVSESAAVPADWPTDWRQKLAGEDKKTLERLGRMNSPADLFKSYRALEQRVSSGDLKKALPADATPEQVAEYRKENGIPDTPDGYKIELPNGLVLGDSDKPLVNSFTAAAHAKNWDNAKVNEALNWYYGEQERLQAERAEADRDFHIKSQVELRGELGAEFTPSLNAVKNMLAGMPEGAADNLLAGRLKDGTVIGDNPGVIKWLAGLAKELNPAATLIPAGSGDAGKSVDGRLADIEKLMGDRSSDYWRGPKADAMQQEYRDLVDAREKMKSRAA